MYVFTIDTTSVTLPARYCAISSACVKISPSVPAPAVSFTKRHDNGDLGSADQLCRYCARTFVISPSLPLSIIFLASSIAGTLLY